MCEQTIDYLSIAAWNINGLYEKIKDELFLKEIVKHDVIFITETHLRNENNLMVKGYYSVHRNQNQTKHNGKIDGGIAMLCKEHLKGGITIVNDHNPDYLWFKLDSNFFSLEKHLYICAAYLPHEQSQYLAHRDIDVIESLETDIVNLSQDGYILLLGDLNARSGVLNDFVNNDNDLGIDNEDGVYLIDENVGSRNNEDSITNDRGTKLVELCIQSRIRILNGRTLGDSLGSFTCHRPQGNSTVDYMILSEEMLHRAQSFKVHDKLDLSDHCKISMWMKCKIIKADTQGHVTLSPIPPSYKWEDNSIYNFQLALNNPDITQQLSDLQHHTCTPDKVGINLEIQTLNDIIHKVAARSLKTKKHKPNTKHKAQPWYTSSLKILRQRINSMGKILKQYPNDPLVTGKYYKLLKEYRRSTKIHKRAYKQDMINKLNDLHDRSPKEYWKLLNRLKQGDATHDKTRQIDPSTWLSHFKHLNKKSPSDVYPESIIEDTTPIPQTLLNKNIEICEVQKAIKALKNGKACGLDGISNEMIKYSQHVLTQPLTKIFNDVLSTGIYPSQWAQGYISPIYKSGNPHDPSNYRGITITSCIAKVFNSVLNNRLEDYLTVNNIIHESQIAFKKNSRTSDHMFVLRTLIDKMVKNDRKKLYTCFVDFQKAFDSIPHGPLLHKLQNCGVNGNFLKLMRDMYSKTSLCVKTQQQLTTTFPGEVGVRQGDILSPNIFKIFINDLPDEVITQETNPPQLKSKPAGCLMYADDLVLLSESKTGLQTSLQNLANYCDKWGLTVNTKKTKVIIFGPCKNPSPHTFWLANKQIEVVNEYKYLGIVFKSNGSFDCAQQDLYHRGLKAYFKMAKMLSTEYSDTNTILHLFDHTIKPVLLYASEIWGCIDPNLRRIQKKTDNKLDEGYKKLWSEKLQLKMCKYVLGVHKKTTTLAVRGETGRYPLYLEVSLNILKYLNHLLNSKSDLIRGAVQLNIELANQNKYCWLLWANTLIQEIGTDTCQIQQPPSKWLLKAKQTLRGQYFSLWKKQLNPNSETKPTGNKLRTYQKFKTSLTREPYLDTLKSRPIRRQLAQLRTSSHKLHIETGRYNKTQLADRTCLACKSKDIEDEEHFLIHCPTYYKERHILFNKAMIACANFSTLDSDQKFIWLMTAEDTYIIHALSTYVTNCHTIRLEAIKPNR
jgi:exonuclease III